MKCPNCQTDNLDDSKYCKECATSLTGAGEAQPSSTKILETPVESLTRGSLFASRSMEKHGFLERHGVVRYVIKKDLLYFALPWILVMFIGFAVSFSDGWEGLFVTFGKLISQPKRLFSLPVQSIAGLALIVFGFVLIFVGHFTLWRFYSSLLVIKTDHKLITHGVYRFVRHPIYLGTIMACIGFPVYTTSLLGAVIMSLMIPVFLIRIRMEEKLLIDEFGDAYRNYKETTNKLIPFIY
jgi:protein-S-isoprenylcysteine O-methyltransferase Ste14